MRDLSLVELVRECSRRKKEMNMKRKMINMVESLENKMNTTKNFKMCFVEKWFC